MHADQHEFYDKTIADKPERDSSRSQTTGADQFSQHEKATHAGDNERVDSAKRIGTTHTGSTVSNDLRVGVRLLRVAVLAVCYFVLEMVAKTVTVMQFIFVAWQKRPHPGMQRLGTMIAEYMHDLWGYCTFASDDAPWPFRPWPRGRGEVHRSP